jgi:hypothetical protein
MKPEENFAGSQFPFSAGEATTEINKAVNNEEIAGAIAAILLLGLDHFLAVDRGDMAIDEAITSVFLNVFESAVSSGLLTSIPAFIPALLPRMNTISISLLAIGSCHLANQVCQIIDNHGFVERNALLEKIHKQDASFFEGFDRQVAEYLNS